MMRVLYWLKDYWYLPLIAGVAIIGYLAFRGRGGRWWDVKHELEVIEAGRQAREAKACLGAAQAAEQVREQHAEALALLDVDQAKEAERLKADPVALSRFLVRVGGKE